MANRFYNDIYEILQAKGCKGLPVRVIARQVYNRHAGLFTPLLTFEDVYQNVRFYLWAQSQKPSSPFTKTGRWGWYALKPGAGYQMQIDFSMKVAESLPLEARQPEREEADYYPSLF